MKNDTEHRALVAELEKSRAALAASLGRVAETLDVPARVVSTLRKQPRWVLWTGGAALAGTALLGGAFSRRRYYISHPVAAAAVAELSKKSSSYAASGRRRRRSQLEPAHRPAD